MMPEADNLWRESMQDSYYEQQSNTLFPSTASPPHGACKHTCLILCSCCPRTPSSCPCVCANTNSARKRAHARQHK